MRVPYRVVGLVVGPKGATIKRIQQQTSTYIVTPSREKEPIFEVTGMPDNVDQAKREIEAHIALRTGLLSVDGAASADGLQELQQSGASMHNGLTLNAINGLSLGLLGAIGDSDMMSSLYKTPSALRSAVQAAASSVGDVGGILGSALTGSALSNFLGDNFGLRPSALDYAAAASNAAAANAAAAGAASGNAADSKVALDSELQTLGSGLLTSLYDSDEGIGLGGSDSPTMGQSLIQPNIWSTDYGLAPRRSNSFGFPTTSSSHGAVVSGAGGDAAALPDHPPARRISSDPLTAIGSTLSSLSAAFQMHGQTTSSMLGMAACYWQIGKNLWGGEVIGESSLATSA